MINVVLLRELVDHGRILVKTLERVHALTVVTEPIAAAGNATHDLHAVHTVVVARPAVFHTAPHRLRPSGVCIHFPRFFTLPKKVAVVIPFDQRIQLVVLHIRHALIEFRHRLVVFALAGDVEKVFCRKIEILHISPKNSKNGTTYFYNIKSRSPSAACAAPRSFVSPPYLANSARS